MLTIVQVEEVNSTVNGTTVKVTLRRDSDIGFEYVSCDDILIFDEDSIDEAVFEEWKEMAEAGEEGYTYELIK